MSRVVSAPERGERIDGFVRRRWALWLEELGVGDEADIHVDRLAQQLASNSRDKQTWPRRRVRRWLKMDITVSVLGAFEAGEALSRLGVHVCGPEGVIAAGHFPAFIRFLAYLASEEGGALHAVRLGVLLPAAYASMMAGFSPSELAHPREVSERLHSFTDPALKELREAVWPRAIFQQAWEKMSRRKPLVSGDRGGWMISLAYDLAASPQVRPENAIDFFFPFLTRWILSLAVSPAEMKRLFAYADAFEDFQFFLMRRSRNTHYGLYVKGSP